MSNLDTCFVCGAEFDQSHVSGPKDWPGVVFVATGNWGSTIFDPPPFEPQAMLKIRICDKCVVDRQSRLVEFGNEMNRTVDDCVIEFHKRQNKFKDDRTFLPPKDIIFLPPNKEKENE